MESVSAGFVPAAPSPPGVISNFDNPQDVLHTANWVNTSCCLVLVNVFAAVRLYVKVVIKRDRVLIEDYSFLIAWALTVFFAVGILRLTHYGEGYHVWEISQDNFREFLKWLYVCTVVYIPAAYATKVTLLLLIARVFSVKERIAKAIRYFIIALFIAYIPIQIPKIAICKPISAYWVMTAQLGVTAQNPHCLNQTNLFIADISVAVITDVFILVIPIPLAMSISSLSLRNKLKIIGLLSAGGAATATTVYRFVKIVHFIGSTDPTADFTLLSIFTLLELVIGIICACLPALNVLVKSILNRNARRDPNVARTGAQKQRTKPETLRSSRFSGLSDSLWSKLSRWTVTTTVTQANTTAHDELAERELPAESVTVPKPTLKQFDTPSDWVIDFDSELAGLSGGRPVRTAEHASLRRVRDEEEGIGLSAGRGKIGIITTEKDENLQGRNELQEL